MYPAATLRTASGARRRSARCFDYEDLVKCDKANPDIFWLRDEGMEDTAIYPSPDVIADGIPVDLRAAVEQLEEIARNLAP